MDEGTQVLQAVAGANGRGGINPLSFLASRIYNIVYYPARAREYIIYNAKRACNLCSSVLYYGCTKKGSDRTGKASTEGAQENILFGKRKSA